MVDLDEQLHSYSAWLAEQADNLAAGRERDRAVTVEPIERHRRGGRWWPLLAVAATVVAVIAAVSLVGSRGTRTPTTEPTVTTPPTVTTDSTVTTSSTVPAAATGAEFLSGLSPDSWVVPSVLPDGYEVLAAIASREIVLGGDDVAEIRIVNGGGPFYPLGVFAETTTIAGVEWRISEAEPSAPLVLQVHLDGSTDPLWIESFADREVTFEVARLLTSVNDGELDIDVLTRDHSWDRAVYPQVAERDGVRLGARGVNGFFCWQISGELGIASGDCRHTEPGAPVAAFGWISTPDATYTAGLAESDVAAVEFYDTDDALLEIVNPGPGPGQSAARFWIADTPGVETAPRAVAVYDDGNRIQLARSTLQPGVWEAAATDARSEAEIADSTDPDAQPAAEGSWAGVQRCPSGAEVSELLGVWVTGGMEWDAVDTGHGSSRCVWGAQTVAGLTYLSVETADNGSGSREFERQRNSRTICGSSVIDERHRALMTVGKCESIGSGLIGGQQMSFLYSAIVFYEDIHCHIDVVTPRPSDTGEIVPALLDRAIEATEFFCGYRFDIAELDDGEQM